jgi:hypothetical protein
MVRFVRRPGPFVVLASAVCVAGFGLHAAHDWHRHGELGTGFFHLHFHVGEHEHGYHGHTHGHPHPGEEDHHRSPEQRQQRSAVLTVAHALSDLESTALELAPPEPARDRQPTAVPIVMLGPDSRGSADPRAPPV